MAMKKKDLNLASKEAKCSKCCNTSIRQQEAGTHLHSQSGTDQVNDCTKLVAMEIHGNQQQHLSEGR